MKKNIPAYVDEMSEGAIDRLKTYKATKNHPIHSFAFMSDSHYCNSYVDRAMYSIEQINKECEISFVCLGGDYLCNNSSTPKQVAETQLKELGDLLDSHKKKPVTYVIKGNHDENPFGVKENMVSNEYIYNTLMHSHKKNFILNDADPLCMYGYYDVPDTKIRAIFVDMMDKDVPGSGIGNAQLNWIANNALKLPSKDWAVVFFAHFEPISDCITPETYFGGSTLWEIIRAFKDGRSFYEKLEKNGLSLDVHCNFAEKGNVIAYICGHHHCDYKFTVDGINIVTIVSVCSDNFGVVKNPDGKEVRKIRGSGEESSFSIFTVDEEERSVNCIRCGSGDDFSFKY